MEVRGWQRGLVLVNAAPAVLWLVAIATNHLLAPPVKVGAGAVAVLLMLPAVARNTRQYQNAGVIIGVGLSLVNALGVPALWLSMLVLLPTSLGLVPASLARQPVSIATALTALLVVTSATGSYLLLFAW